MACVGNFVGQFTVDDATSHDVVIAGKQRQLGNGADELTSFLVQCQFGADDVAGQTEQACTLTANDDNSKDNVVGRLFQGALVIEHDANTITCRNAAERVSVQVFELHTRKADQTRAWPTLRCA